MFITLTNASPKFKGQSITINSEHIVTLWRGDAPRATSPEGEITESDNVTFIFVPPHGTWEVEEQPEEITTLLNR